MIPSKTKIQNIIESENLVFVPFFVDLFNNTFLNKFSWALHERDQEMEMWTTQEPVLPHT